MLSFASWERGDMAGVRGLQTEGFLEATMGLISESHIVLGICYSTLSEWFPRVARTHVLTLNFLMNKSHSYTFKRHMASSII